MRMTVALILSLLARTATVGAATFVVTDPVGTLGDAVPGNGVCESISGGGSCTWPAALEEANARLGPDAIVLPAGVFGAPIRIMDPLVIAGAGADVTAIDANGGMAVIVVESVDATLIGVTVQGGNKMNGLFPDGGGIRSSDGHLTLVDCVVRNNSALNVGGGINQDGGTLTMIRTTVRDNFAFNVGGGVYSNGARNADQLDRQR